MFPNKNIDEFFVSENAEFEELLSVLSKQVNSNYGSGFAIVLDSDGNIVGIVEDSDLRKFYHQNPSKNPRIKDVMQTNFISVSNNLNETEVISEVISQMDSRGWATSLPVKIIPVLDNLKPIGLIDAEEIHSVIQQHKNNYVVVGLGYVGLTLALSLSALGRRVYGFDADLNRIDQLLKLKSYILEPGIDSLLKKHLNSPLHMRLCVF